MPIRPTLNACSTQSSHAQTEAAARADAAASERDEARLRAVIEALPDGVVVHVDRRIVLANTAAARLYGLDSANELIGRSDLEFVPSSHREQVLRQTLKVFEHGPIEQDILTKRADGQLRWLHVTAKVTQFGDREAVLVTLRDITDRKRIETELRESEERYRALSEHLEERVGQRTAELEAANRDLEAFSYSVSHDLRAPLRHVSAHCNMLLERPAVAADGDARRHADSAIKAVSRLAQLVDDLLHFSRMGRAGMHRTALSMQELVEQVQRDLEPELQNRTVRWQIGTLPNVVGDMSMLKQVWQNLLGNAVKYTRNRPVARVQIDTVYDEQEFIFFVRDNGVGFDPQYAGKLFGVFERLHGPREFEGTGIGLANVRRIIQRHGGRVWAESAVDAGASFYFSLPQA
jgi:PAS domain S-box-containing protein